MKSTSPEELTRGVGGSLAESNKIENLENMQAASKQSSRVSERLRQKQKRKEIAKHHKFFHALTSEAMGLSQNVIEYQNPVHKMLFLARLGLKPRPGTELPKEFKLTVVSPDKNKIKRKRPKMIKQEDVDGTMCQGSLSTSSSDTEDSGMLVTSDGELDLELVISPDMLPDSPQGKKGKKGVIQACGTWLPEPMNTHSISTANNNNNNKTGSSALNKKPVPKHKVLPNKKNHAPQAVAWNRTEQSYPTFNNKPNAQNNSNNSKGSLASTIRNAHITATLNSGPNTIIRPTQPPTLPLIRSAPNTITTSILSKALTAVVPPQPRHVPTSGNPIRNPVILPSKPAMPFFRPSAVTTRLTFTTRKEIPCVDLTEEEEENTLDALREKLLRFDTVLEVVDNPH